MIMGTNRFETLKSFGRRQASPAYNFNDCFKRISYKIVACFSVRLRHLQDNLRYGALPEMICRSRRSLEER